jgi:hypothetical protein
VKYSILFRNLRWNGERETLSKFVAEQHPLERKIEATGVTLTLELDRVIDIYIALPPDRLEFFKIDWYHGFYNTPYLHDDMIQKLRIRFCLMRSGKSEHEKRGTDDVRRHGGRRRRRGRRGQA